MELGPDGNRYAYSTERPEDGGVNLVEYKHRRDGARHEALDRLAKADVEAGTYDKVVLPEGAEEE